MTLLIDGPEKADNCLVLAHGAGAGMDTEFMQTIAEGLAAKGIRVVRFEFPYMQRRRAEGRKFPPNKQDVLLESFVEVLSTQQAKRLFIGGKSMGGRIASMLAHEGLSEQTIQGVVCLGYPFFAPKKPRELAESRVAFLSEMQTPTLIVQGERDTFGRQDELQAMALPASIQCQFLPDGDHSFKPRVKSGYTLEQNMMSAVDRISAFIL